MDEKRINYSSYLIGGLIGAFIGVVAAFLIERSSEFEGDENPLSRKRLSKLGLGIISFLWQLIDQGKGLHK